MLKVFLPCQWMQSSRIGNPFKWQTCFKFNPCFFFQAYCLSLTANHFLPYIQNIFSYPQGAIHYIWQSIQMGSFSLILYNPGRWNESFSLHWIICTRLPNCLVTRQHPENPILTGTHQSKTKTVYLIAPLKGREFENSISQQWNI